jgi:hypothetical protein
MIVMDDTPLAMGIIDVLSRKSSLILNRYTRQTPDLALKAQQGNAEIVILGTATCANQLPDCLMDLITSPTIKELLLVHSENNLIQKFTRKQVKLTNLQDFARLF